MPFHCEDRSMLWEIEIIPWSHDEEQQRVAQEFALLTHAANGSPPITRTTRGYLLEGDLDRAAVERLAQELLVDVVAEQCRLGSLNETSGDGLLATVLLKPGVMDPAALSIVEAARDLGITLLT